MEILGSYGREELAVVHVARLRGDNRYLVEFVESLQPPIPRERKWVLIVSHLLSPLEVARPFDRILVPRGLQTCELLMRALSSGTARQGGWYR